MGFRVWGSGLLGAPWPESADTTWRLEKLDRSTAHAGSCPNCPCTDIGNVPLKDLGPKYRIMRYMDP